MNMALAGIEGWYSTYAQSIGQVDNVQLLVSSADIVIDGLFSLSLSAMCETARFTRKKFRQLVWQYLVASNDLIFPCKHVAINENSQYPSPRTVFRGKAPPRWER